MSVVPASMFAIPEPASEPPRVMLIANAADIATVVFTRDGELVLGDPVISDTIATLYDYAAPYGRPATYSVTGTTTGGDTFSGSATATLEASRAWLVHPQSLSLSLSIDGGPLARDRTSIWVDSASAESKTSGASRHLSRPVGRRRSVVVTHGPRAADEWTLVLTAPSIELKDRIRNLVDDQTPLLLRSPASFGWDLPDGWYSVGDVEVRRLANPIVLERTRITLPLTPVDVPLVKVGSLRTWQTILDQYDTWGDVLADNASWFEVLMGDI